MTVMGPDLLLLCRHTVEISRAILSGTPAALRDSRSFRSCSTRGLVSFASNSCRRPPLPYLCVRALFGLQPTARGAFERVRTPFESVVCRLCDDSKGNREHTINHRGRQTHNGPSVTGSATAAAEEANKTGGNAKRVVFMR